MAGEQTHSTPALRRGSWALRPGSPGRRSLTIAGLIATIAVAACVVLVTRGAPPQRYGSIPNWLPKPKVAVDRIVQASAAHPQLSAIEGSTVSVRLAHGQVLANVVGPVVPEEVAEKAQDGDDDAETAPCTFTVTFRSAAGVVPLNASAFTILDERGQLHRLQVSDANGGPPPTQVLPGKPVTLTMKATLPEGEGALRWAPKGPRVIAGWVFGLELD